MRVSKKTKLRDDLSNRTIDDALDKLELYGMCNIVRPTGFGKSYMLAKITSSRKERVYRYKKCLYVYPLDVIKQDVSTKYGPNSKVKLRNTTFLSYRMIDILNKSNKLLETLEPYDLVMLDECHMCGAEGFKAAWENMKDLFGPGKKHVIGVTASPDRMDSFDVLEEMLGGEKCSVFPYDIADAYDDGLMEKPIYIRAVYDKDAYKKSVLENYSGMCQDKKEEADLERKVNKIEGAERVIKRVIAKRGKPSKYMKFIVFYVDKQDLLDKKDMVKEWFTTIYPDKDINEYNIVSTAFETEDCSVDSISETTGKTTVCKLSVLNTLGHNPGESDDEHNKIDNTIDIINCIDMLNMGYHVDDITGIIMLRNTRSQIIYTQQMGRCQSVNANNRPFIFDFVNNCMTKMYFKSDKESDESAGIQTMDREPTNRRIERILGEDVVVADGISMVDEVIKKVSKRKEYNKSVKINQIQFWYNQVKAPLYILSLLNKKSPEDLVRILEANEIEVEAEDKVLEQMTPTDRENFEYLKKSDDLKIAKIDPSWIKLRLSKRVKEV